jgi:hypothetical protein
MKCKLQGESPKILQSSKPGPMFKATFSHPIPGLFTLEEAQIRSKTCRGFIQMSTSFSGLLPIYWHRRGHLPENSDGHRVCAAGSKLWSVLLNLKDEPVWFPDDPLCAMEVLARAANDDPMFAILAP